MIFISGTPCVGKSTVAKELSDKLNLPLVDVKKQAIENNLILGIDQDKGYKIVDIEAFDEYLQTLSSDSIVESHLSHLFSNPSHVIILRVHPDVLYERLKSRNYSESKIRENLEAEALGVCSVEAYQQHGDLVSEIDCTDLSVCETVDIISNIINGKQQFPVGEIDFMDWLIQN